MTTTLWQNIEPSYKISDSQADIWLLNIKEYINYFDYYYSIISIDEQERANRFYFQKDRDSFTVARGVLRSLLSKYLQILPENIYFIYNEYGKPILKNHHLEFNLSHSGDFALFAFAKNKVGIDIEFMRDKISYLEISQRFFSIHERNSLKKASPESQKEAFFNGWTRKEAYIKAKGKGLSIPLDSFDVSLENSLQPELIDCRDDEITKNEWKLFSLETHLNYKAAVIVEKTISNLNYYNYKTKINC